MTKQVHIEEHTPEWHQWRSEVCSASEAPAVMGKGKFYPKTPYQLYEVHTGQKEVFYNQAMKDGNELEETVLNLVNMTFGTKYKKALFERELLGVKLGASLDGYDSEAKNKVLEIKCVSENSDTWKNGIGHYMYQVQQQMAVTDSESALFFVYNKDSKEYKHWIIERRNDIWSEILDAWLDYTKAMNSMEAPKLTKTDYVESSNEHALKLAESLKETNLAIKALKNKADNLKSELIELANGKPTKFGKVSVFPVRRKGAVDYSAIEELKGVDLGQYRKEDKTIWSVR